MEKYDEGVKGCLRRLGFRHKKKGEDQHGWRRCTDFGFISYVVDHVRCRWIPPRCKSSERDFHWYAEVWKWPPDLKYIADQTQVIPRSNYADVKLVGGALEHMVSLKHKKM